MDGAISRQMFWHVNNSEGSIISREMKVRYNVTLTFAGTVSGSNYLINTGYDAFRANPLAQMTESASIKLNDQTVTSEPTKVDHILDRIGNNEEKNTRVL